MALTLAAGSKLLHFQGYWAMFIQIGFFVIGTLLRLMVENFMVWVDKKREVKVSNFIVNCVLRLAQVESLHEGNESSPH